jgi:hypothetical protein
MTPTSRRGAARERVAMASRRGYTKARTTEEVDLARDAAGKPTKRALRGGLPTRAQARKEATHVGVLRSEDGEVLAEFPMVASAEDPTLFGILTKGPLNPSWELSLEREGEPARKVKIRQAASIGKRLETYYYAVIVA